MKHRTLGITGGLGPETSCAFCLSVNNLFKSQTGRQPHIILDNLPISKEAEERLIKGGPSQEHFDMLVASVIRLNTLQVDVIVIACNTVHVFIDDLRRASDVPILSIVEETARACRMLNVLRMGILGSTKTIQSGLHTRELAKWNIESIVPGEDDQDFVSKCIVRIINNNTLSDDKKKFVEIIGKLVHRGAQGIVLGCTDLPLLLSDVNVGVPVVNTTKVLEDAAVSSLVL